MADYTCKNCDLKYFEYDYCAKCFRCDDHCICPATLVDAAAILVLAPVVGVLMSIDMLIKWARQRRKQ